MMRHLHIVAMLAAYPGVLAHELAHYAVARTAGDGVRVRVAASRPRTTVESWRPDASGWRIVAAAYAPLLAGLGCGAVAAVGGLVTGWAPPATVRGWAIASIGLGWYAVFVLPSADDVRTAREGLERVRR